MRIVMPIYEFTPTPEDLETFNRNQKHQSDEVSDICFNLYKNMIKSYEDIGNKNEAFSGEVQYNIYNVSIKAGDIIYRANEPFILKMTNRDTHPFISGDLNIKQGIDEIQDMELNINLKVLNGSCLSFKATGSMLINNTKYGCNDSDIVTTGKGFSEKDFPIIFKGELSLQNENNEDIRLQFDFVSMIFDIFNSKHFYDIFSQEYCYDTLLVKRIFCGWKNHHGRYDYVYPNDIIKPYNVEQHLPKAANVINNSDILSLVLIFMVYSVCNKFYPKRSRLALNFISASMPLDLMIAIRSYLQDITRSVSFKYCDNINIFYRNRQFDPHNYISQLYKLQPEERQKLGKFENFLVIAFTDYELNVYDRFETYRLLQVKPTVLKKMIKSDISYIFFNLANNDIDINLLNSDPFECIKCIERFVQSDSNYKDDFFYKTLPDIYDFFIHEYIEYINQKINNDRQPNISSKSLINLHSNIIFELNTNFFCKFLEYIFNNSKKEKYKLQQYLLLKNNNLNQIIMLYTCKEYKSDKNACLPPNEELFDKLIKIVTYKYVSKKNFYRLFGAKEDDLFYGIILDVEANYGWKQIKSIRKKRKKQFLEEIENNFDRYLYRLCIRFMNQSYKQGSYFKTLINKSKKELQQLDDITKETVVSMQALYAAAISFDEYIQECHPTLSDFGKTIKETIKKIILMSQNRTRKITDENFLAMQMCKFIMECFHFSIKDIEKKNGYDKIYSSIDNSIHIGWYRNRVRKEIWIISGSKCEFFKQFNMYLHKKDYTTDLKYSLCIAHKLSGMLYTHIYHKKYDTPAYETPVTIRNKETNEEEKCYVYKFQYETLKECLDKKSLSVLSKKSQNKLANPLLI